MKTRLPVCLALLASLLGGCATSYRVNVSSLAKADANAISYALRNASPIKKDDTLRYREAANLVRTALSGRGLFEAPANVVPDVIVELDFGVDELVRQETRWESSGPFLDWDRDGGLVPQAPQKWEQVKVSVITYEKYLRLNATENPPAMTGENGAKIWSVDVTSEGKSKNLREYLPVLVAASIEYVGKDSKGVKTIRIKDTDADVVFVKKGM